MRAKILASAASLLVAGGFFGMSPILAQEPQIVTKYMKGEMSLKFKQSVTPILQDGKVKTNISTLDSLLSGLGVFDIKPLFPYNPNLSPEMQEAYFRHQLDRWYQIYFSQTADLKGIATALTTDVNLATVSVNTICQDLTDEEIPNDQLFNPYQWPLKNNTPAYLGHDIEATFAWKIERGNSTIKIGLLDTGVQRDPNHPDLGANVLAVGWNVRDNNTNTTDEHGHGTALAGLIGATTNNTIGVAGVCRDCKVLPIKLDPYGPNNDITDAHLAQGIYAALDPTRQAKVLNMSWGFYPGTEYEPGTPFDPATSLLRSAVAYGAQFALLIAAMGNQDAEVTLYPATYDSVIAVGGTRINDRRWKYMGPNYGNCNEPPADLFIDCNCTAGIGSTYGNHIDVVAPGNRIMTTQRFSTYTDWDTLCGTSASAAIVSGLAGLIYSHDLVLGIGLTHAQVREVIEKSSEDQVGDFEDTPGWDKYFGWGRVNALRALVAISRGDVNSDGVINVADRDYIINYLFNNGPAPTPHVGLADVNCNGTITLGDVIYLNNYLSGGPRPLICYQYNY